MKKTTWSLVGLTIVSTLGVFVGCSTNTTTETMTSNLADSKPALRLLELSSAQFCGRVENTAGSATCVGSYNASAKITNSATGTIWFTPPSGTTNCIITDASGLSDPHVTVVWAARKRDLVSWCGTNTVTFPAESTNQYKFLIYIKNTLPPPTNGQVLTLDVQWNP